MAKNYYEILGVANDATPDQIKAAYRRLALKTHTDKKRVLEEDTFQNVNEAYKTLSNPDRRAQYDNELAQGHSAASIERLVISPNVTMSSDGANSTGALIVYSAVPLIDTFKAAKADNATLIAAAKNPQIALAILEDDSLVAQLGICLIKIVKNHQACISLLLETPKLRQRLWNADLINLINSSQDQAVKTVSNYPLYNGLDGYALAKIADAHPEAKEIILRTDELNNKYAAYLTMLQDFSQDPSLAQNNNDIMQGILKNIKNTGMNGCGFLSFIREYKAYAATMLQLNALSKYHEDIITCYPDIVSDIYAFNDIKLFEYARESLQNCLTVLSDSALHTKLDVSLLYILKQHYKTSNEVITRIDSFVENREPLNAYEWLLLHPSPTEIEYATYLEAFKKAINYYLNAPAVERRGNFWHKITALILYSNLPDILLLAILNNDLFVKFLDYKIGYIAAKNAVSAQHILNTPALWKTFNYQTTIIPHLIEQEAVCLIFLKSSLTQEKITGELLCKATNLYPKSKEIQRIIFLNVDLVDKLRSYLLLKKLKEEKSTVEIKKISTIISDDGEEDYLMGMMLLAENDESFLAIYFFHRATLKENAAAATKLDDLIKTTGSDEFIDEKYALAEFYQRNDARMHNKARIYYLAAMRGKNEKSCFKLVELITQGTSTEDNLYFCHPKTIQAMLDFLEENAADKHDLIYNVATQFKDYGFYAIAIKFLKLMRVLTDKQARFFLETIELAEKEKQKKIIIEKDSTLSDYEIEQQLKEPNYRYPALLKVILTGINKIIPKTTNAIDTELNKMLFSKIAQVVMGKYFFVDGIDSLLQFMRQPHSNNTAGADIYKILSDLESLQIEDNKEYVTFLTQKIDYFYKNKITAAAFENKHFNYVELIKTAKKISDKFTVEQKIILSFCVYANVLTLAALDESSDRLIEYIKHFFNWNVFVNITPNQFINAISFYKLNKEVFEKFCISETDGLSLLFFNFIVDNFKHMKYNNINSIEDISRDFTYYLISIFSSHQEDCAFGFEFCCFISNNSTALQIYHGNDFPYNFKNTIVKNAIKFLMSNHQEFYYQDEFLEFISKDSLSYDNKTLVMLLEWSIHTLNISLLKRVFFELEQRSIKIQLNKETVYKAFNNFELTLTLIENGIIANFPDKTTDNSTLIRRLKNITPYDLEALQEILYYSADQRIPLNGLLSRLTMSDSSSLSRDSNRVLLQALLMYGLLTTALLDKIAIALGYENSAISATSNSPSCRASIDFFSVTTTSIQTLDDIFATIIKIVTLYENQIEKNPREFGYFFKEIKELILGNHLGYNRDLLISFIIHKFIKMNFTKQDLNIAQELLAAVDNADLKITLENIVFFRFLQKRFVSEKDIDLIYDFFLDKAKDVDMCDSSASLIIGNKLQLSLLLKKYKALPSCLNYLIAYFSRSDWANKVVIDVSSAKTKSFSEKTSFFNAAHAVEKEEIPENKQNRLLLESSRVLEKKGVNLLVLLTKLNKTELVKRLIAAEFSEHETIPASRLVDPVTGSSLLQIAAKNSNEEIVRLFLTKTDDKIQLIAFTDESAQNALHTAAKTGNTQILIQLFNFLENPDIEKSTFLQEDIDGKNGLEHLLAGLSLRNNLVIDDLLWLITKLDSILADTSEDKSAKVNTFLAQLIIPALTQYNRKTSDLLFFIQGVRDHALSLPENEKISREDYIYHMVVTYRNNLDVLSSAINKNTPLGSLLDLKEKTFGWFMGDRKNAIQGRINEIRMNQAHYQQIPKTSTNEDTELSSTVLINWLKNEIPDDMVEKVAYLIIESEAGRLSHVLGESTISTSVAPRVRRVSFGNDFEL